MADFKKTTATKPETELVKGELVEKNPFEEKVVAVDRISRTVAGGRRMRFRALVVVGDRNGRVGVGVAKSNEVASATAKASKKAKKNLITVPLINDTIPHDIQSCYGSAVVLLKPAPAGTSVIAGGPVRAVVELAGIRNITSKILGGTSNKLNNVMATYEGLRNLRPAADRTSERAAAQADQK
jgi:small subunit ribosomal protein S5